MTIPDSVKPVLKGFVGAILGGLVLLLCLRMYQTDQLVRAIVAAMNANAQQQQARQPPPGAVQP